MNLKGILRSPIPHSGAIVIIALLVYSNTFNSPFVFDDILYIVNNSEIKNFANMWPPSGTRWLGFLSFAINYRLGGLDPFDYHIVNLFIHMLNSLLVYWLVILTFRTPFFNKAYGNYELRTTNYEQPAFIAFFSALLFACHPIQTQAVTYIWQRITSLATMFYLLSLVLYIKARFEAEVKAKFFSTSTLIFYFFSIFSAVLAMKTKEISFTLPFILCLYEFRFFGKSESVRRPANTKRILYLLPFIFALIIIPLGIIWGGFRINEPELSVSEGLRYLQLEELRTLSTYEYLLTQFRVVVTYLRLLFLPLNQNFDYDYPVYHSFLNASVFFSFLFLVSILSLGIRLFFSKQHAPQSPFFLGFGIIWFFITLSVESSLIPIRDVIFEHRVYLPSVGFFMGITSAIQMTEMKWPQVKKVLRYFMVVLIIVFSIATYSRNEVWSDKLRLYEDNVLKSPNKAERHNDLGNAYLDLGRIDEATSEFMTALKIKPDYSEAYVNLGVIYAKQGYLDKAINEYLTALKINPDFAGAHYNLGNVYAVQGHIDKAISEYLLALKINPDMPDIRCNLGVAYANQGRIDEAIKEFKEILKINPEDINARHNLKVMSEGLKMEK